tara:strand:- start:1644 stop:2096 length:453 start_codon:yes stop_codon:yes gene_type:complete
MKKCADTRTGLCIPKLGTLRPGKRSKKSSTTKKSNESQVKGQNTRKILNPAFTRLNMDNPVFQHVLNDKITDFERSVKITAGVSIATSPFLTKLRFSGVPGFLASSLIVGLISAPIVSYAQSADQYRDLVLFASTREIHGTKVMGDTHLL